MKSSSWLLIGGLALSLCVAGAAGATEKGEKSKDKAAMAAAAKISIEQAIKTASDKMPGKIIEAELEHKNGKLVWEIEIVKDGHVTELHVDSATGDVIASKDKKAGKEKKDRMSKSMKPEDESRAKAELAM